MFDENLPEVPNTVQSDSLGHVYALAQYVWGSDIAARQFLTNLHPQLHDRSPLEVSLTVEGAKQVKELLWQIYYGVHA